MEDKGKSREQNKIRQINFESKQKDKGFSKRSFFLSQQNLEKVNEIKINQNFENQHEALRFIIENFKVEV